MEAELPPYQSGSQSTAIVVPLGNEALGIESADLKCPNCNEDVRTKVKSSLLRWSWWYCLCLCPFPGLLTLCMNGFKYEFRVPNPNLLRLYVYDLFF